MAIIDPWSCSQRALLLPRLVIAYGFARHLQIG